jgi:hypothetical protein
MSWLEQIVAHKGQLYGKTPRANLGSYDMQMDHFDKEAQKISAMCPDALDFWWHDIEALLDETPHLWTHLATKQDIHNSLMRGAIVAWSTATPLHELHFLAFTLEIERPGGNCLRVVYQAGDETYGPLFVATLEAYAKRQGCPRLEFMGPKEQTNKLLALGYSVTEVIVSRELSRLAFH